MCKYYIHRGLPCVPRSVTKQLPFRVRQPSWHVIYRLEHICNFLAPSHRLIKRLESTKISFLANKKVVANMVYYGPILSVQACLSVIYMDLISSPKFGKVWWMANVLQQTPLYSIKPAVASDERQWTLAQYNGLQLNIVDSSGIWWCILYMYKLHWRVTKITVVHHILSLQLPPMQCYLYICIQCSPIHSYSG